MSTPVFSQEQLEAAYARALNQDFQAEQEVAANASTGEPARIVLSAEMIEAGRAGIVNRVPAPAAPRLA